MGVAVHRRIETATGCRYTVVPAVMTAGTTSSCHRAVHGRPDASTWCHGAGSRSGGCLWGPDRGDGGFDVGANPRGPWLHLLAFALLAYVRVLPYEQAATVQDR
jgi:hypothetical protein